MKEPVHFAAADNSVLNIYQGGKLVVQIQKHQVKHLIREAAEILVLGDLAVDDTEPPRSLASLLRDGIREVEGVFHPNKSISQIAMSTALAELEGR